MSWTETTREQYRRDGLDYASSMKHEEWALLEPFMPAPEPLGRPRKTDLRAVVNAQRRPGGSSRSTAPAGRAARSDRGARFARA